VNIRGWVYVISNQAMPGLLKVGFSTKDPHLRARELSHTGSPQPYVVEYDALVRAPRETEQQIHKALRDKRDRKEWFRCSLREAIAAIHSVTTSERIAESYRDKSALELAPVAVTSLGSLASMRRSSGSSSARWRWSERTQQLAEKGGCRTFGPERYSYDDQGQVKGFAVRDRDTLWVPIEDVEIVE
jgi:T5orf172 domain